MGTPLHLRSPRTMLEIIMSIRDALPLFGHNIVLGDGGFVNRAQHCSGHAGGLEHRARHTAME